MDDLSLSINGTKYSGWKDVAVTRSIEQLASTFSVGYAEIWSAGARPLPINQGDAVLVRLDDDDTITGYVEEDPIGYDARSHTTSVRGRSKLGDPVDCVSIHKGGAWRNSTITQIARDLLTPFGLEAITTGDMGKAFRKFAIEDGETVQETLERASRMRALMLLDTPEGKLHITRRGTRQVSTTLRRPGNIKSGSRSGSSTERFSKYIGKAQIPGDDSQSGDDTTITRTVTDDRVKRYRPTIITAETEDTAKELRDRIIWERNRRAGGARRVTYTVQGWRDDAGDLWEPNTLVPVSDDFLRVEETLLVVSVSYTRNSTNGTLTQIELAQKEAFDLIEMPPPKPKSLGEDYYA